MKDGDRHDLGVLFVHGIGQQVRGGTLAQFGDPICEWLGRWSGGTFVLDECNLDPPDDAPAHARLRSGAASWLLTECHWADAFHEPTFSDLMKWAFVGIPWVLGAHFNGHIVLGAMYWRSAHYRLALFRFIRALGASVVAAVLMALVAAFFPILFLFAIVPALRQVVVGVQRLLSSVLGDSYLFVESPIQQAAVVSQFRRDLKWLCERARRVAIVAHSQGAAVAYFGCKGWMPDASGAFAGYSADGEDRVTLVTFGSGLPKLQVLRGARALRHGEEHGAFFAWTAPFGVLLIAAAAYLFVGGTWGSAGVAAVVFLLGLFSLLVGSAVTAGAPTVLREEDTGILQAARWTDITATRDLVSNISLAEFFATGADRDTIARSLGLARLPDDVGRVENLRSRLSDHVTYFRNADGFLPVLVSKLLRAADQVLQHKTRRWSLPETGDATTQARIARAAARRRWRVAWRGWVTAAWTVLLLALLAVRSVAFPADIVAAAQRRLTILDAEPVFGVLAPMLRALVSLPPALTGAASIGILGMLALLVVRLSWAAWEVSDRWRFFEGSDYALSLEFWSFAGAAAITCEAFALMLVGWTLLPPWFALFIAAVPAMGDALLGLAHDLRTGGKPATSQEGLAAVGRFAAAALVLWPLFAGLSHAGLDTRLLAQFRLPPVGTDPSRFWMGILVGWPVWTAVRLASSTAMRRLRAWSACGPAAAAMTAGAPGAHQGAAGQQSAGPPVGA